MHRKDHLNCSPELIKFIFSNSAAGSNIQKFVTHQFAVESWAGEHAGELEQWAHVYTELRDFNVGMADALVGGELVQLFQQYAKPRANEQSYFEAWAATITGKPSATAKVEGDGYESDEASIEVGGRKRKLRNKLW